MGSVAGRVCIITGAGGGLGREHALLLAAEGARVVVNDYGVATDGTGSDSSPARETVELIREAGGEAVANSDSVADWDVARGIVRQAIDEFGDLHVVVNNAGVAPNRELVDMTRNDYERVVAVHLTGHFGIMRWAAEFWRDQHEAGVDTGRSIVNTASGAMLGLGGLADYSAVKAGIAAATISIASELEQYNVRVNCIAPIARSRLARQQTVERLAPPDDPNAFDMFHPGNVSPLVVYLATEDCPFTGAVFHASANEIGLFRGWTLEAPDYLRNDGRWSVAELRERAPALLAGRASLASQRTTIADTFPGAH